MRPEIKKATENGSIQRINELWSAVFQLNTLSNNMVDEISDVLELNKLRDGRLKQIHNNFIKAADRFFTEFNTMVKSPETKMEIFRDMDDFREKIYKILALEERWEPSTNTTNHEQ
jgi:predicted nucleic acid-binding protein